MNSSSGRDDIKFPSSLMEKHTAASYPNMSPGNETETCPCRL